MKTKHRFFPGTKWLYFKIYCGETSANKILKEVIFPFVGQRMETQVKSWFFIRYRDPEHHLRFRVECFKKKDSSKLFFEFNQAIEVSNLIQTISKIQLETYVREVSRYGVKNISIIESFWSQESDVVLDCINNLKNKEEYLYSGFYLVHLYVQQLFVEKKKMFEFSRTCFENFSEEFSPSKEDKKILSRKFVEFEKKFHVFLDETIDNQHFESHRKAINSLAKKLDRSASHQLEFSLIHMLVNRFFLVEQRKMEFVIYHHLSRFYKSNIAKLGII